MTSSRSMSIDPATAGEVRNEGAARFLVIGSVVAAASLVVAVSLASPLLGLVMLGILLATTVWYAHRIATRIAGSLDGIRARSWDQADHAPAGPLFGPLNDAVEALGDWAMERDLALRDALQRERLNFLELEIQSLSLQEAHERLEEVNAELEAFTYSASHDLAVPLRTIESFAELLREAGDASLGPEASDYLDRIEGTAQRVRALIADLLVLSRMRDVSDTEYVDVDFGTLVDEIAVELRETFEGPVTIEVAGELPTVMAPPERIRPVLQNLMQNGLKYNLSETPTVVVKGVVDGGMAIVSVIDNGIGIPEVDRERVFELFSRGQAKSDFAGTGAGLAIARRAARSLGGELWLEATSSQGSTFTLAVPADRSGVEGHERPWLKNYLDRDEITV